MIQTVTGITPGDANTEAEVIIAEDTVSNSISVAEATATPTAAEAVAADEAEATPAPTPLNEGISPTTGRPLPAETVAYVAALVPFVGDGEIDGPVPQKRTTGELFINPLRVLCLHFTHENRVFRFVPCHLMLSRSGSTHGDCRNAAIIPVGHQWYAIGRVAPTQ